MKISPLYSALVAACICPAVYGVTLLEHVESESGALRSGYSNVISVPFSGVGAYANQDGVNHTSSKFKTTATVYRLDVRGASNNSVTASIAVYVNDKRVGSPAFAGSTPSVQSFEFTLDGTNSLSTVKFVLENDTGANDTFIDWYELYAVGDVPPPPPAPVLPTVGAYNSGVYRNLFKEAGYTDADVTAKVNAAYEQLYHSSNRGQFDGQALMIPDPTDASMAYIWNPQREYNDVRSEGMSYAMMVAVQMNRQDDFNKLWKWATTYTLNTTGESKGYFGWRASPSGAVIDKNPAPDGEEYYATALFFAANRWGNGTGIFNYSAQANKLLDDMYNNGITRWENGQQVGISLFDKTNKQVVFSPAQSGSQAHTDASYHLPAFYELWAKWATNNKQFWADLATTSRAFIKKTSHPTTGLAPDYSKFDGTPDTSEYGKDRFQYDAWRVISNVSLDYSWWKKDEWATTYAKRLHSFFTSKGVDSYPVLFELDGRVYNNNADHSPGLVAMNAVGALASDNAQAWPFVQALWNTSIPTGEYRYYDGSLYMLGMLAASGKYRIYCPGNDCGTTPPTTTNTAPKANNDSASGTNTQNITVNALANDTDADNDVLSITSNTNPTNGTVTRSGGTFTYKANTSFVGTDSFQYTISDGKASSTASVSVSVSASATVNVAPKANNDSASGTNAQNIVINALANDTDANGDVLSITSNTPPTNGTVTRSGGTFTYKAKAGFIGTDSFQYTLSDGKLSSAATVTVNVTAAPTTGGAGTLLATIEAETGTFYPSYRGPITSPFNGAILYQNGEYITYLTNKTSASGKYSLTVSGAANNGVASTAAVYVNNVKVGDISFTGTTQLEKTLTFTTTGGVTSLKFAMETDVGQSDYLMDWVKLYAQ